jgi:hypothetical protein
MSLIDRSDFGEFENVAAATIPENAASVETGPSPLLVGVAGRSLDETVEIRDTDSLVFLEQVVHALESQLGFDTGGEEQVVDFMPSDCVMYLTFVVRACPSERIVTTNGVSVVSGGSSSAMPARTSAAIAWASFSIDHPLHTGACGVGDHFSSLGEQDVCQDVVGDSLRVSPDEDVEESLDQRPLASLNHVGDDRLDLLLVLGFGSLRAMIAGITRKLCHDPLF